jgi:uncharacterized repeat protein (TIGR01451 family)
MFVVRHSNPDFDNQEAAMPQRHTTHQLSTPAQAGCRQTSTPRTFAPQSKRLRLSGTALLLLGLCSCVLTESRVATDPFLDGTDASRPRYAAAEPRASQPRTGESAGHARLDPPISQEILQTAGVSPPVDRVTQAILQSPHDRRLPGRVQPAQGFCPEFCNAAGPVLDCQAESPCDYPDEYLCDGGDRGDPVHYNEEQTLGLDTEDTVAEYQDENGRPKVKHSNRVCVYAPRFGAVTTISSPVAGTGLDKLAGSVTNTGGTALRGRVATAWHDQREMTERMRTRSRASGIETENHGVANEQTQRPTVNAETLNVFENRAQQKQGELLLTEKAQLEIQIEAAITWTRDQFPVVQAQIESAGETLTRSATAEFVGRKQLGKPGDLRLIKTADKKLAAVGDIITFTIRYENFGDRQLSNVVILDNLTPRLEYVDDSATSDRDGRLVTEDNGEGSLILRWELDQPLPGRTRGVVSFQARVK